MKSSSIAVILMFCGTITINAQQSPANSQITIHKTPFMPDSLKGINRVFLSLYMGAGEGSANYTGLHQFDIYQGQPYNTAPQYFFEIAAGKPDKFYFSWLIKGSFVSTNNYGIKTTSIDGYTGFNVGHCIYNNSHSTFLSSISPELGLVYGGVNTSVGDAQGQTLANALLLNGNVSFDLLKWNT